MKKLSVKMQAIILAIAIAAISSGWIIFGAIHTFLTDKNLELGVIVVFCILLFGIGLAITSAAIISGLLHSRPGSSRASMFFFPAAAIIALAAPSTPSKYDTLRQLISIGAWLYVLTIFIRNHRRIRTETEQSSVVR